MRISPVATPTRPAVRRSAVTVTRDKRGFTIQQPAGQRIPAGRYHLKTALSDTAISISKG